MTGPGAPADRHPDDQRPDRHPADLVAERVLACPVVVSLSDGALGQVATYLPGRRVVGVSWRDEVCEVAVVLRLDDRPLPELAEQIRQAVEPVAQGRAIDVLVADVVVPDVRVPDATVPDVLAGRPGDLPFVPYEE